MSNNKKTISLIEIVKPKYDTINICEQKIFNNESNGYKKIQKEKKFMINEGIFLIEADDSKKLLRVSIDMNEDENQVKIHQAQALVSQQELERLKENYEFYEGQVEVIESKKMTFEGIQFTEKVSNNQNLEVENDNYHSQEIEEESEPEFDFIF